MALWNKESGLRISSLSKQTLVGQRAYFPIGCAVHVGRELLPCLNVNVQLFLPPFLKESCYVKGINLSGLWQSFEVCFLWAFGPHLCGGASCSISLLKSLARPRASQLPPSFADRQGRHFGHCHATKSCVLEHLLSLCQLRAGDLVVGIWEVDQFLGSPSITLMCFHEKQLLPPLNFYLLLASSQLHLFIDCYWSMAC